jgi:flagellar protein FlaG
MEVGQLNITADQVAPERQQSGNKNATAGPEKLTARDPGKARAAEESRRAGNELARTLVEDVGGESIQAPNELRLRVEEDINTVVAKIVNSETDEVVREIPPEELVDAAKKLDALIGQILDRDV